MKQFHVLMVGQGHDHAAPTAAALYKRKDIQLLGFVTLENEKYNPCGWNGEDYKDIPRFTLEEALKLPNVDCAFIETEDSMLCEIAQLFVSRGIAVQMDKPGGQDPTAFNTLFDTAEKMHVPLHMGYMYRYNPGVRKIKEYAKSGKLGKVLYVEADMSCIHQKEKRIWLKKFQGGMMNFLGCHLVDLVLQLLGTPEHVTALNRASNDTCGEDIGVATLEYPFGVSVVRTTAVEYGGFLHRHILVVFEKGSILLSPTECPIQNTTLQNTDMYISLLEDWQETPQKISFPPYDRYDAMFDEFFEILRGTIQNPYSYEYEKELHHVLLLACGYKENTQN